MASASIVAVGGEFTKEDKWDGTVFYKNEPVEGLKAHLINQTNHKGGPWIVCSSGVYCETEKHPAAPIGFKVLGGFYAVRLSKVYYKCKLLEKANPHSFEVDPVLPEWATSGDIKYFEGEEVRK